MAGVRRSLRLAGQAVALAVLLLACDSTSSTAPSTTALPSAPELLTASATAMAAVTSAHFTLTVSGQLPELQVQGAEGDLTSSGNAKGNAKITQFGQLIQVEFVFVAKDLYIKGATGGFTKIPAALAGQVYDPTAILNADKGVAKVLRSVTAPGSPTRAGSDIELKGTVPKAAAVPLVPGIASDVAGTFTFDATSSRLTDVRLGLTGSDGKPATVDLAFSDFNKPVTVAPPA